MDPSIIAVICHEANRLYCQSIGDFSQLAWKDAPEWQQTSALMEVQSILNGGISTPKEAHDSWAVEKTRAGWVYGEAKDAKANPPTHPCLVPYEDLPIDQQRKDALFFAIVNALK